MIENTAATAQLHLSPLGGSTSWAHLHGHSETATTQNNLAALYEDQGRYDEAESLFRRSVAVTETALGPNHPDMVTRLNNLASLLIDQGHYGEAQPLLRRSLTISEATLGPEHPTTAVVLSNLGSLLGSQGRYDEAESFFRRALAIERKTLGPDDPSTATTMSDFAILLRNQGRYSEAERLLRQALQIRDANLAPNHPDIAVVLANLATVLEDQGRYEEAASLFRRALSIEKVALGRDHPNRATTLNNFAALLMMKGRYDEAESVLRRALSIRKAVLRENHPDIAGSMNNLAVLQYDQGHYLQAIQGFERAVAILEDNLEQFSGQERRDYLASVVGTYRRLVSAYLSIERTHDAFFPAEQSAARLLVDKLAVRDATSFTIPPASKLRQALATDEAIIVYANAGTGLGLGVFVLTHDKLSAVEVPDSTFEAETFTAYRDRIVNLDGQTKVRRQQQRAAAGLAAEAALGLRYTEGIVQFYRRLLVHTRHPTRSAEIAGSQFSDPAARDDLARRFYDLLIAPVAEHLSGKTKLIIVPNGPLGFLPFETLIDDEGRYLAERFDIRYAPSATVWHTLQQNRTGDAGQKPLLAFGGAVYDPSAQSQGPATYANAAQVEGAQRRAYADLTRGGDLDATYNALGYGSWGDLPGTRAEVEGLAETVPGAEIVTGPAVSEAEIKRRSEAGELAQYRLLHFATHGLVVPEVPELSALVLSQDAEANAAAGEDGYLRMAEIADLNLNAAVVTLSACETGLGQLVDGEGIVGLTYAFMEAGARGVSASLWQVSDRSTSVFMQEVYRKVQDEGLSFAEAHTEVKRGFIRGDYLDAWRAPYYWAPYVYYGYSDE